MQYLLEVHFPNLDPVIVHIVGGFALRWYGLGYLLAFLAAFLVMRRTQKGGYLRLAAEDCGSLLMYAVIGVFLGGRIGYLLFYDDFFSSGRFFLNPLHIVGLGKGDSGGLQGLSFHGGLIGVVAMGTLFVCRRARWQFQALSEEQRVREGKSGLRRRFRALWCECFDACALGVPLGIFFVRCANFINGELYGRVVKDAAGKEVLDAAAAPAWAMRFPTSPEGQDALRFFYASPESPVGKVSKEKLHDLLQLPVNADHWEQVRAQVALRHPSQLYQALCEGLLVLALVWFMRKRVSRRGIIGGLFLLGYALARVPMERYRQPDGQFSPGETLSGWGSVLDALSLTQGQLLSLLTGLGGILLIGMCKVSANPFLKRTAEEGALSAAPLTAEQAGLPRRKQRKP